MFQISRKDLETFLSIFDLIKLSLIYKNDDQINMIIF